MYNMDGDWIKKVTYSIGVFCCFNIAACKIQIEKNMENEAWQQKVDSIGNATLDSIYKMQVKKCDSLQKNRVPVLVDSFIKNDSIERKLKKRK